jgi:hypothetical protein
MKEFNYSDEHVFQIDGDGDASQAFMSAVDTIENDIKPDKFDYSLPLFEDGTGTFEKDGITVIIEYTNWDGTELRVKKGISEEGLKQVREWAGLILKEYKSPSKIPSVEYGFELNKNSKFFPKNFPMMKVQGDYSYLNELNFCHADILNEIMPGLQKVMNDELPSYEFGYEKVIIEFEKENSTINKEDFEDPVHTLVIRSSEIYNMMNDWAELIKKWNAGKFNPWWKFW